MPKITPFLWFGAGQVNAKRRPRKVATRPASHAANGEVRH